MRMAISIQVLGTRAHRHAANNSSAAVPSHRSMIMPSDPRMRHAIRAPLQNPSQVAVSRQGPRSKPAKGVPPVMNICTRQTAAASAKGPASRHINAARGISHGHHARHTTGQDQHFEPDPGRCDHGHNRRKGDDQPNTNVATGQQPPAGGRSSRKKFLKVMHAGAVQSEGVQVEISLVPAIVAFRSAKVALLSRSEGRQLFLRRCLPWGLSQFSLNENGTVPFRTAIVIVSLIFWTPSQNQLMNWVARPALR